MTSIEVRITETVRDCPWLPARTLNVFKERFQDIDGVKEFLAERYGKLPKGRNKVYVDKKDGGAEEVGFTHSFWNQDISHGGRSWFQTDWIELVDVEETVRLL